MDGVSSTQSFSQFTSLLRPWWTCSNPKLWPSSWMMPAISLAPSYGFSWTMVPPAGEVTNKWNYTAQPGRSQKKKLYQNSEVSQTENLKKQSTGFKAREWQLCIKHNYNLYNHGPSLQKKYGGDKSLVFAFRWSHHVHSTVVRLFLKLAK